MRSGLHCRVTCTAMLSGLLVPKPSSVPAKLRHRVVGLLPIVQCRPLTRVGTRCRHRSHGEGDRARWSHGPTRSGGLQRVGLPAAVWPMSWGNVAPCLQTSQPSSRGRRSSHAHRCPIRFLTPARSSARSRRTNSRNNAVASSSWSASAAVCPTRMTTASAMSTVPASQSRCRADLPS